MRRLFLILLPAVLAGLNACAAGAAGAQVAIDQRQFSGDPGFTRIVPGEWSRADIERTFGPPARVESVASWNGPIWTYRWRDAGGADMFYSVYFDPQGIVRRAHPSMEVRDRFFDFRF